MSQGNQKKGGHNKKGFKSIGSQVGSNLGGHISSIKNKGKGKSFGSNLFSSISSWLGGSAYAKNMGDVTGKIKQLATPSDWKTKQFADKNLDITKMNPSFRINIDTQKAINSIKDENTKAWLNKWVPDKVKNWNINHQMYSPTKVMPGDPGYNPTGTGSPALDPDTQAYLDWAAKVNPTAMTVADAEKMYANQIAEGSTLEQAMSGNPAETGSFYALIPDDEEQTTSTPTKDTMTTTTKLDLDNLYASILGRGPDAYQGGLTDAQKTISKEARDYWNKQFTAAGGGEEGLKSVISGIQGSKEFAALGLDKDTYKSNPKAAQHRVQAAASIARGDGVRAGSVASFSDKYNPDGTVKSDWVSTEKWNQDKIESLMAANEKLKNNPKIKTITNTVYVDKYHPADTSKYDKQIADLKKTIAGHETDYESLMKDYKSTKLGYDSLYAQAAYGNKPQNLTVKGVKTQNELPGYQPKTSGTSSFNRKSWMGPLAKSALTIGSLNLA